MTFKVIKYSLLIGLTCACVELFSQQEPVLKLVNPLIGTTKTKINSLWGGEGGTYPGAVAPFGIVQLTPETRITEPNGYDYRDSTIYWFSCVNHLSGYPNGSSGQIKVMPVSNLPSLQIVNYRRLFSHRNEKSEAGYYRVRFSDDGTLVETTAAVHSGMFRFTFPPKIKPRLFIADLGKIEIASKRIIKGDRLNAIISLNADFIDKEAVADGCFLTFAAANKGKTEIIMKIGVSQVSLANSEMNLKAEAQTWDFDQFKKINQQKWNN